MASWSMIEAPLDSSGRSRGEERAPVALRAAGLAGRIGAHPVLQTDAWIRVSTRDPATGVLGAGEVRRASATIAARVRAVVSSGRRPLVVGGDCTVLLGVFLGLGEGTRLWFIDGHADFLDGESSPTGEAADMTLAILSGHGPPGLLGDVGTLVEPSSVVLLGPRPDELGPEVAMENARVDPAIPALSAIEIRRRGAKAVGEEIAVSNPGGSTWLHVDLDVLDEEALPAVTYPQPLGLAWEELIALGGALVTADGLVGVSIADFNPDLDPDGTYALRVVDALSAVLG